MGLIAEHGFCALLDLGDKKVLWDTGQGLCLAQNPARMGIDLAGLHAIALSHGHFDHTGGLDRALQASAGARVVCQPGCMANKRVKREFAGKKVELYIGMPRSREEYGQMDAKFEFEEDTAEVAPGVHFLTGIPMETEFEAIEPGFFVQTEKAREQDTFEDDACLAVQGDKGVSVILGCAHRGMINTILHVKKRLGVDRIYSVWGGTHMMDRAHWQVEATINALRELGVEKVGAAHCTGLQNEVRLAQEMPDKFVITHVGTRAEL